MSEREKFEAWYRNEKDLVASEADLFDAWQARAALEQPASELDAAFRRFMESDGPTEGTSAEDAARFIWNAAKVCVAPPSAEITPEDRERAKSIIENIERGFAAGETLYFDEVAALLRKAYL